MPQQVCMGALMQCSFGMAPSSLVVLPTNRVMTDEVPDANIMDHIPLVNIMPFGMCQSPSNPEVAAATAAALGVLTPMPCVPATPAPWVAGAPTVLLGNFPTLDVEVARATYRYGSRQEQWIELRMRIREIAQSRVRYGYRMIRVLLNREGWKVGKDLVYRLYKEEGLGLRQRPSGRRRAVVHRQERFRPTGPNQVWAMDFVADQLCDGRRFRSLTVVDIYTRESLAIEVEQSLKGEDVVRVLNRLKQERGVPKMLFCDNGSEFTGQMMDLWAYRNGVKIDFSRPGKPTDNAFVESFNGTFRSECLDTNWFSNLEDAQQIIEAWRREYNESRPHRALANRTPEEFAIQIAVNRDLDETKTSQFLTL